MIWKIVSTQFFTFSLFLNVPMLFLNPTSEAGVLDPFVECGRYVHFYLTQEKPPFEPLAPIDQSTEYLNLVRDLWKEHEAFVLTGSDRPKLREHIYRELDPLIERVEPYLKSKKIQFASWYDDYSDARSLLNAKQRISKSLTKYHESKKNGQLPSPAEIVFWALLSTKLIDKMNTPFATVRMNIGHSIDYILQESKRFNLIPQLIALPYSKKLHWMEMNRTIAHPFGLIGISLKKYHFYDGGYHLGSYDFAHHDKGHVIGAANGRFFTSPKFSLEIYRLRNKFVTDFLGLSLHLANNAEEGYYAEGWLFSRFKEGQYPLETKFLNSGDVCGYFLSLGSEKVGTYSSRLVGRLKNKTNMGEGLGKYKFSSLAAKDFFGRVVEYCKGAR